MWESNFELGIKTEHITKKSLKIWNYLDCGGRDGYIIVREKLVKIVDLLKNL
jgi:hypothetical protein